MRKKPRIVALHGFTGSGADFGPLEDLTRKDYEWCTPDLPGHGACSSLPFNSIEDPLAFTLRQCKEQVPKAWLEEDEGYCLLGYSMGGRIALHWALSEPQGVERLLLIGASPGVRSTREQEEKVLFDEVIKTKLKTLSMEDFTTWWQSLPLMQSQKNIDPAIYKEMLIRRFQGSNESLLFGVDYLSAAEMPSLWKHLEAITQPTLLLCGKKDPKYLEVMEAMKERIPYSLLEVLEHCGHMAHLEQPLSFVKAMKNFIENTSLTLKGKAL